MATPEAAAQEAAIPDGAPPPSKVKLPYRQEIEGSMTTLTVTAKGQVTLRKEFLQHLGVEPGEKIEVRALPGGRIEVRAAESDGRIEDFFGLLAAKTRKIATIDEIDEAAARGWAGRE